MHTNHIWAIEGRSCSSYLAAKQQGRGQVMSVSDLTVPGGEHVFTKVGNVARIEVNGVIVPTADAFSPFYGEVGLNQIAGAVQMALADDDVDQILMVYDSPGGSAKGLDQASLILHEANKEKPITAQVDGMMASAAYYLGSQASRIVTGSKLDLVGSIGTRTQLIDASRMFANAGVEVIPIDTGEFKSAGTFGTPITEEQKAYFQGIVDLYQAAFVKAIQRGRGLTTAQVEAAADGQVFGAEKARALGLIDAIQTESTTFTQLKGASQMAQETTPATLQEIEASCHGIDSAFACDMLRRGVSLDQAKDQWMQEQSLRLALSEEAAATAAKEKADADAAALEAETTAAQVAAAGVPTLETASLKRWTASSTDSTEGDSAASFNEKVDQLVSKGIKRMKAVGMVARKHPELREAMVAEAN